MSSIQSQFSAEQIAALISGETVSFSNKTSSEQVESIPAANEISPDQAPTVVTPSTSISIEKVAKVTAPNVKDNTGKIVSPASQVVKPDFSKTSELERKEAARRAALAAEEDAKKELAALTDSTQLLNTLNGLRRIVEKQGKEIAALKKGAK